MPMTSYNIQADATVIFLAQTLTWYLPIYRYDLFVQLFQSELTPKNFKAVPSTKILGYFPVLRFQPWTAG